MGGAPAATVVIARKNRDLVNHFRCAGALSPDTAASSASIGVEERHAWHRLARRGIIRQAPNSGYYLDQDAWALWEGTRRKRALAMIALVIALFIAGLIRTWLQ